MKKLLAVLAVSLLLGADSKNEKLEGTWKAVAAVQNGQEQNDAGEHTLTFTGDTFTVARDGETRMKGTFKTDATKKPKTIDWIVKEGRNAGKTIVGIYELDGDTLKVCFDPTGRAGDRPTEFKTTADSGRTLLSSSGRRSSRSLCRARNRTGIAAFRRLTATQPARRLRSVVRPNEGNTRGHDNPLLQPLLA